MKRSRLIQKTRRLWLENQPSVGQMEKVSEEVLFVAKTGNCDQKDISNSLHSIGHALQSDIMNRSLTSWDQSETGHTVYLLCLLGQVSLAYEVHNGFLKMGTYSSRRSLVQLINSLLQQPKTVPETLQNMTVPTAVTLPMSKSVRTAALLSLEADLGEVIAFSDDPIFDFLTASNLLCYYTSVGLHNHSLRIYKNNIVNTSYTFTRDLREAVYKSIQYNNRK